MTRSRSESPPTENQAADPSEHQHHVADMVAYYSRTADRYNLWHADLKAKGTHNFAVRQLLRLMAEHGYKTILDVCCGTGRAVKICLEAGFDAHGIDISSDLIDQGVREWRLPKDRFTVGDATQLPYEDHSFDVTCVLGALHHCAIPHRIVEEMSRVTRYGLVVSDEGNHLHRGIKEILMKLGLFALIYRVIFRRAPRQNRRAIVSAEDGPAYDFSTNEILPMIRAHYRTVRTFQFYRVGKIQIGSRFLPRLFARNVVVVACSPRKQSR